MPLKLTIDTGRAQILDQFGAACAADERLNAQGPFDATELLVAIADELDTGIETTYGASGTLRAASQLLSDTSATLSVAGLRAMILADEIWSECGANSPEIDVAEASHLSRVLQWVLHTSAGRKVKEADEKAHTDVLTALPNRRAFERDTKLESEAATPRAPSHLVFIDLDDFKEVNTAKGHAGGDLVLQEFAAHLSAFRVDGMDVYRLAGDEFVLWFRGVAREEIDLLIISIQAAPPAAFTAGLASAPAPTLADALNIADREMEAIKQRKRESRAITSRGQSRETTSREAPTRPKRSR